MDSKSTVGCGPGHGPYDSNWKATLAVWLQQRTLTLPDYAVLCSLEIASLTIRQFVPFAKWYLDEYGETDSNQPPAWWKTSARRLVDDGLAVVVDRQLVDSLQQSAREGHTFGPVCGLPQIGTLDLSESGAKLLRECHRDVFTWVPEDCACHCAIRPGVSYFVGVTEEMVRDLVEGARTMMKVRREVESWFIGSWRDRWWRSFPNGYLISVECDPCFTERQPFLASWGNDRPNLIRRI